MLFSLSSYAFLSPEEEKSIIDDLNHVCARTWCRSNDSFSFQSIRCMKVNRSCLIGLRFKDQKEDWVQVRSLRCLVDQVNNVKDLVGLASEAPWSPLNEEIYKSITECLMPYLLKPDSCKF